MPRKGARKTNRGTFVEEEMKLAVTAVLQNKLFIRKDFNLSRTTLARYIQAAKQAENKTDVTYKKSYVTRQVFKTEDEKLFVDYILECSKMFHGLSVKATRKLAYEYAKRNNRAYPNSWDTNCIAGYDWFRGLMMRHKQLSIRMPEATSMARAIAFNQTNVNNFFDNYESILQRDSFELDPNRLWNLDESGIRTVPNATRILAEKGVKQVGLLTSAEKGTLVTICACVNAAGNSLPPAYIFPRVNFKDHMMIGAPHGSKGFANSSGWMNRELFPQVLTHFISQMNISKDKPGILVMDNHDSHTTIDVIDLAREKGLIILTFPPHCSHRMQPLDVSVFGPFKTYYDQAATEYLLSNKGKGLTIYNLATISATAFCKAFTIENVQAGFRKTGIFPLNRNIFPHHVFMPNQPFDRPQPTIPHQENIQPKASTSRESTVGASEVTSDSDSIISVSPGIRPISSKRQNNNIVSPVEIRPFPTAAERDPNKKTRKGKKSSIITDTPERQIISQGSKKNNKNSKRGQKRPQQIRKSLFSEKETSEVADSSDSDSVILDDSSDASISESEDETIEMEDPNVDKLDEGDYILVKFDTKKTTKYYVGKIESIDANAGTVDCMFLKRKPAKDGQFLFVFPDHLDASEVPVADILCKLLPPSCGGTVRTGDIFTFNSQFIHGFKYPIQ